MKILMCSHFFAPSVGGVETVTKILAEQFNRLGANVTVVTHTPGDAKPFREFEVVRRPPVLRLFTLARKSDIVLLNNVELRTALPVLFCGRPIIVVQHGIWTQGKDSWLLRLKCALFPLFVNLSVGKAVAEALTVKSTVIGNPIEVAEFTANEETVRDKDIVFMGRLVSQKGCEVALRALAILKEEGIRPSFTVIGDGPEMPALQRLSNELRISQLVNFRGMIGPGRGKEVARHKIMVIPSVCHDAFPLVPLEGIAAGCVLAASDIGGLPEGVGPCGLLFPMGDATALAAALKRLLTEEGLREKLLAGREAHLQRFQPGTVARRYLEIFTSTLNR